MQEITKIVEPFETIKNEVKKHRGEFFLGTLAELLI